MIAINHEREFPIPGIPGNIGLQFPSRKSGMEFSTPNPVPENGNGIFHSHSRSRKWEWNFMEFSFPFPLPGMEHQSQEKYLFRDILYFRQSKSKYMIQHQRIIVDTLLTILEQINFVIDNAGID